MKIIFVSQVTGRNSETGVEEVTPTAINGDLYREFYPRKPDGGTPRIGTRISFEDGGGFAVAETFAEMNEKFRAAGIPMVALTKVDDVPAIIDDETGNVLNEGDEAQSPASVNPMFMRAFYPRKNGKVGTRITSKGSGMAVADLFEAVTAMVA
jgi:hypothetical protein